jgi:hypothetical protein
VDQDGRFLINQTKTGYVSLSADYWAEYEARPEEIDIHIPDGDRVIRLAGVRGYPFFMDKKISILGDEQNSLSALSSDGELLWTYDFAAPITYIDAAADLVLAGSLDGAVELLNNQGQRIFFFEPGGSRYAVICGCRISQDGSRIAVISGIDDQRFLFLERFGDAVNFEYKVVYHEFLRDGFRRAVHLAFIDQDRRVVFEREGGLGLYEISTRTSLQVSLNGTVTAIDDTGSDGLLFVLTAPSDIRKELVGIRLPGTIVVEAPFKSETAFLGRQGSRLYVGGGATLASFDLGKR